MTKQKKTTAGITKSGIKERIRHEADQRVALVLSVLHVLRENGNYMSPENIGPRLTVKADESITVEQVTQICNELVLAGWLRTVGGAYVIKPREADDHYGKPSFARASTVGGILGPIMLDEVGKRVKACAAALDPDGNSEPIPITAETLPGRIGLLREAYTGMYNAVNDELKRRHAAEQELATLHARYKDDITHVESLLHGERASSAALAKRFEVVKLVLAMLAKE